MYAKCLAKCWKNQCTHIYLTGNCDIQLTPVEKIRKNNYGLSSGCLENTKNRQKFKPEDLERIALERGNGVQTEIQRLF